MKSDRQVRRMGFGTVSGSPRNRSKGAYLTSPIWARAVENGFGWFPVLGVLSAFGLLIISFADLRSRFSDSWAEPLFWGGMLLIFLPVAVRLVSPRVTRAEMIALVVFLGMALYLVKLLHSPVIFTFHDEFFHWRTTNDILKSGRLFSENPLLPISALFPGLDIVTTALASMSGLSIFTSGILLIGVARFISILGIFLLFERLSGSSRIAGVGSLLYMTNPNYLFFLSIFKYESLALPFVFLALFAILELSKGNREGLWGLSITVLLSLAVIATTHHLTSYVLIALLLLWAAIAFVRNGWEKFTVPGGAGIALLAMSTAWYILVAQITVKYLWPHFRAASSELFRVISRDPTAGRSLFDSPSLLSGNGTGSWEQYVGYASVGLILLVLPVGLLHTWRSYHRSGLAITFALGTLLYPITLALRFTRTGWEIANRSSEFIFLLLAFVLAVGIIRGILQARFSQIHIYAFGVFASILLLGGTIAGWPPQWRMPKPGPAPVGSGYLRKEELAVAQWMENYLGPGNRVGSDQWNNLSLGSYGMQHVSHTVSGGQDIAWILYAPEFGESQLASLQEGRVQYLVVDQNAFREDYIHKLYPGISVEQALLKFEQEDRISRIFHSGDVTIYYVGEISNEQRTP